MIFLKDLKGALNRGTTVYRFNYEYLTITNRIIPAVPGFVCISQGFFLIKTGKPCLLKRNALPFHCLFFRGGVDLLYLL